MIDWKNYSRLNNWLGWVIFIIATTVYLMTIGPTASLWDCAEFIACDYKLEIGHPPGAPFYMLIYNIATHLAPSPAKVALFANAMSAILSGFTILFLFWTITYMVRKVLAPDFNRKNAGQIEVSKGNMIAILGSGLVGALAYTFSDTFWFSAVEAEVYAFSSFFTAIVFWLILVWEERSHEPDSDKWIILIAYLMGLSIGVHLLNLLCIPAMALVVYYKRKQEENFLQWFFTIFVSFILIVFMMYGIIQGVPSIGGAFDFVAVNWFSMSVNSGLYLYLAILTILFVSSLYLFHKEKKLEEYKKPVKLLTRFVVFLSLIFMGIPFISGISLSIIIIIVLFYFIFFSKLISRRVLHLTQMCLFAIAVGFSSYGVILVRAMADPPMNENSPADPFSLKSYLAREQYGDKPLLYGPTFVAKPKGLKEKGTTTTLEPVDKDGKTKYKTESKQEYDYDPEDMMLFPRAWDYKKAYGYNLWLERNADDTDEISFADNIYYAIKYQINYMYWRYFLWNFSGRQNDLQGDGGSLRGGAITGFSFIDNLILGDQDSLPDSIKDNKGHNVYYMMPLILGLLGLFFQIFTKRKEGLENFWITMFLFLMTGLAIIAYLNQTPGEPRERDYAYAGSFYAFAIWIGFGVAGIYKLIVKGKYLKETKAAWVASVVLLFVPLQMASQNWDDHDRSGRTIARDMGINYLESCEPNAILFCFGDNDTFPLWYAQEVEGVRTDVRAVNLSYLTGNWYIDQQHKQAYEGKPIPYKYMLPPFYYKNQLSYVDDRSEDLLPLDEALKWMVENTTEEYVLFPTKYAVLPVDSANLAQKLSSVDSRLPKRVLNNMIISVAGKSYLTLASLSVLDMINANNWERPMYWAITTPRDAFSNLTNYNLQVGMNYQLLPLNLSNGDDSTKTMMPDPMLIDRTYNVFMNKFKWCGADKKNTYFDENARNMVQGIRNNVAAPLAIALVNRGEKDKAKMVIQKCLDNIKEECIPYDFRSLSFVEAMYKVDMVDKADAIANKIGKDQLAMVRWILTEHQESAHKDDLMKAIYFGNEYAKLSKRDGKDVLAKERDELNKLMSRLGLH